MGNSARCRVAVGSASAVESAPFSYDFLASPTYLTGRSTEDPTAHPQEIDSGLAPEAHLPPNGELANSFVISGSVLDC